MKTDEQIAQEVLDKLAGKVNIGDVVFHLSHPKCWNLVAINGNMATCELNGEIRQWPTSELCDINKYVPEVRAAAYERNWGELNNLLNRQN